MRSTDAQPDQAVRPVPLDKLEISPANVRKTDAGLQAFAELKANIAALGVLSNLVVRPVETDAERFAVVAGGRRYAALVDLASEGQVAPDIPVPCRIVPAEASETEISLAENAIRAAMHPADQVEAFKILASAGATVSAIAARFGVAERTVEQRLRLGNAAPELVQAYREDVIDLECLKAFALTTDTLRQIVVWKQVSEQGYRPTAWQIKRMLTEDRLPANAAIAAFVGVDAYEAAGGVVDRDLFADEHEFGVWFEDPELLRKLATERLQDAANEVAAKWKWAEPRVETEWSQLAPFGRVHAIPGEATAEETEERTRLSARYDDLCEQAEIDCTDEIVAECERIEERLSEIEIAIDSRARFTDEDRAIAGCIVTIDSDGRLRVIEGLVRPEDIPSPAANTGNAASTGNGDNDATASGPSVSAPAMRIPLAPSDPAAAARKKAGIGIGQADDLRAIRTAGIKARLSQDFGAAFDLFLYQAARAVFNQGYNPTCLEISVRETPDRPALRVNDDTFAAESPFEADLHDFSHIPLDWMEHEDEATAFAALCALPEDRKQALFAATVARTVKGQLAFEHTARPELESTVARLDIDFAARIRPSADMFWSRINKGQILDIARATLGTEWAAGHSKDKKAILAATMERAFGTGDDVPPGITPETRAAALAWVPPGFAAFDDGESAEPEPQPDQPEPADNRSATPDPVATPPVCDDKVQPVTDTAPTIPDPEKTALPPADPAVIVDHGSVANPAAEPPPLHAQAAHAANGHDSSGSGDGLEIPAFLRRH